MITALKDKLSLMWLNLRYGKPQGDLKLIAISGSVGKTSVSWLVYHVLNHAGIKVAVINSQGVFASGESIEPSFNLNKATKAQILSRINSVKQRGAAVLVLEITESFPHMGILPELEFDAGVLTNIYGGDSPEAIFEAMTRITPEGLAVINADDDAFAWVKERSQSIPQQIFAAAVSIASAEVVRDSKFEIKVKFAGAFWDIKRICDFELTNYLQAIQICMKYVGVDRIDQAIANFPNFKAMMQVVQRDPNLVILDKLHKPWLVPHVLAELKKKLEPQGRVILLMGLNSPEELPWVELKKIVNVVILTAGAEVDESMETNINRQLAAGEKVGAVLVEKIDEHEKLELVSVENLQQKIHRVLVNNGDLPIIACERSSVAARYDAISIALGILGPGDIIVSAGVGAAASLNIQEVEYEWDEETAIRQGLNAINHPLAKS